MSTLTTSAVEGAVGLTTAGIDTVAGVPAVSVSVARVRVTRLSVAEPVVERVTALTCPVGVHIDPEHAP